MAKLAHASISEKGTINGVKGNQSGNELCIREWYDKGWDVVLRPVTPELAEQIATNATKAVLNKNIGYGQSDRTTLYDEAKKVNFKLEKVTKPCNCDCSSLIAVICTASGLSVSKDIYTGNESSALVATGKFLKLTDKKYLTCDKYLKRGDILLKTYHHTATMIEDGVNAKADAVRSDQYAEEFNKTLAKTYMAMCECNLRWSASLTGKVMATLRKGTQVKCYGYYTKDNRGVTWIYCTVTYGSTTYTGFISERCLI